jgi:4-alpha-glucanotransferase
VTDRPVTPDERPGPWGIQRAHRDGFDRWNEVPPATVAALVRAMGADPDDEPPAPLDRVPCHPPPAERIWGLSVQLYAARSSSSWGIGDLDDLATLGRWASGEGAQVLLLNPIDAVAPVTPRETSPYKPTTRRFLDPIYLAIDAVPGADRVDLDDLRQAGRALNADRTIDRDRVWELKQAALARIWDEVPEVRDDPGFADFRAERGPAVERFAAYLLAVADHGADVSDWPAELQDPSGTAATALAERPEAAFHVWQQYCLDLQLAAAGAAVPLLRDLPVGFDPHGFDAWTWRHLLADGVTIGAPPDHLGPAGQDWELPAFVPQAFADADYAPLTETLEAEMRHAAGLRIDHILGYFRLFWIPPAGVPADGAYVHQPSVALLDEIGRVSRRMRTWVVGEDLGTVPEGVRPTMAARDILRYQVLWFDDDDPPAWSPWSLASVTTHDVSTVAGMWFGGDLELQRELGLEPDEEWHWWVRDRTADAAGVDRSADAETAAVGLHRYVASAPSRVVVAQVDDLVGAVERPNVPGTTRDVRPQNWSLALPVTLDDLPDHPLAQRIVAALREERPAG